MPRPPVHIVSLQDLGLVVVERTGHDPIRVKMVAKIFPLINDPDPTLVFFQKNDPNTGNYTEYVLVAHSADGHGDFDIFQVDV